MSYGGGYNNRGSYGNRREEPIPDVPPFTAYVGNLPSGIIQGDIETIFGELSLKTVRLMYDRETNQFKGFGYVEFEEREDLIKAIENFNGAQCEGKNLRVNVATQKRDGGAGGQRGGRGGGRGRGRGGNRGGYNNYNNRGGNEQYHNSQPPRSTSWADVGDEQPQQYPNYGSQQSNRGYVNRGGYNQGGYGRSRMTSQGSQLSENGGGDRPIAQRKKLNLKPRTKPLDNNSAAPVTNSSIFGSGKAREFNAAVDLADLSLEDKESKPKTVSK